MSVANKFSHSVFAHVFLESCLTKSWVWTATSVSVETETCTKSLKWTFVKFMTKIFLKVLTKQASALSLPSLCATVCDWHVCVTQGAAAVSGFYCCWYWLQFWSFRKAPCRRRALTWLTSLSLSLGWGLRAEMLWHDAFFSHDMPNFALNYILIELQWTHNFFAIFPREISPLR